MILFLFLLPAQILIDTIGWTDRDRQFLFPATRYLTYDSIYGVSAVYKSGYGEIRYNFRPRGGNWLFPSGVLVNQYQRNLGCLEYNIRNGKTFISTDYLDRGTRTITNFVDSAPGAGRFQETFITTSAQFPLIAAGRYGYPKFAAIRNDTLYYLSAWSSYRLGHIGPFPRHNIIASKKSSRLGFVWADEQGNLNIRETPDGGGTWYPRRLITDSVPSICNRSMFGAQATYDSIQIHIVADLYDGNNRGRVQLWHYCASDTPSWRFIYAFSFPDTTKLGRYTAALCRPSIGIDRRLRNSDLNLLYVVWEQFDPMNIDPRTGIARADIWASHSPDNGKTWTEPIRLTSPDSTSKRFPFLAETVNDTLHIIYFADQIAGCWELGEGQQTLNPVLYLRVPTRIFTELNVADAPFQPAPLNLLPTISAVPSNLSTNLVIYDQLGRKAQSNKINRLPAGIYFVGPKTTAPIQKLLKVR
jgi:hypothetical protein